jgi:hypothetical protein
MDLFLKAIESQGQDPLSTMVEELEKSTAVEPVLTFGYFILFLYPSRNPYQTLN